MVMQNIYIVYGNPSWSSKFVAALINQSRRYAIPLQYEFSNDKQSCYVWAKDHDGNIVKGPVISIDMAKKKVGIVRMAVSGRLCQILCLCIELLVSLVKCTVPIY